MIPPFHYGTHYSNLAFVLHWLVRVVSEQVKEEGNEEGGGADRRGGARWKGEGTMEGMKQYLIIIILS